MAEIAEWFLEIWQPDEDGKDEQRSPKNIIRFDKAEQAWGYVAHNEIRYYCVYKAECVVDAT